MTDLPQLKRVRWAVRAVLVLGVAASVSANILHAEPNPISRVIAAWPPLALLLTIELISRVPVHRRSLAVMRLGATVVIAGIAAWVSYWHMAGVAERYGESPGSAHLLPFSVDGLVIVASVCLVELAGRIRTASEHLPPVAAETAPATKPDETPTAQPSEEPAPEPEARPARRTAGRPSAAKKVAKVAAKMPDETQAKIARRAGVSDRTVRRHLAAAKADTEPVNGSPVPELVDQGAQS